MYRSTDCVRHWASLALRPQNAASVISKDVVISETTGSFPVNKVLPFLNHIYLCVFYAWEISNLHLWMVSEWAVFTAECSSRARSLLVFSIFLCVKLSHIFTVLVSSLATFHTTFNVCICLCCRTTLGELCSGPARHQVTDITQKNLLTVLITAKCLCTVSSWTLMIFTEIQSAQVRRPLPEPFFSPSRCHSNDLPTSAAMVRCDRCQSSSAVGSASCPSSPHPAAVFVSGSADLLQVCLQSCCFVVVRVGYSLTDLGLSWRTAWLAGCRFLAVTSR